LRHDPAFSQTIKGQTILVTGGAGFIGSHICDLLLADGAIEVRVLDDFSRGTKKNLAGSMPDPRLKIITGDIRDLEAVDAAVRGTDILFHQAAIRITRCVEENRLALDVLVSGTFNVLEAAVRHRVKKVVAASSASVYGAATAFPTTEEHHTYGNRTLYGACKVANEQILRSFFEMHGLPYVALRYFNVYGPRMDVHGAYTEVFMRWLDRLDAGQRPAMFGDGSQTMDFVCVEDVARANLFAMKAPVSDAVFNVASGVETSLREMCEALIQAHGQTQLEPESLPLPPERKGVEIPRRWASTVAAERDLSFKASISLVDGLKRLVEWRKLEKARL
jgi:UDP-glucose 4-epimerase